MTTEGDAPAEEGAPPEVAASEPVKETTEETNPEETVVEEPETTAETTEEAPPEPEQEASTSKPAVMMDEAEIARKLESGDKDDRVAARRARIAARLKAKREAEDPSLIEPEPEPEPTAEETQVKTSKRALARLKAQGFDDVTDVKAVAVAREANRRGERDKQRVCMELLSIAI